MAFTEAGSWKVGTDDMYTLTYDPSEPDVVTVDWEGKCFMKVTIEDEGDASDFSFDRDDLRWMECQKPWLAAVVIGKNVEENLFATEDEAKAFLKMRAEELTGEKASFYLLRINGEYFFEEGRGFLTDKVDPTKF